MSKATYTISTLQNDFVIWFCNALIVEGIAVIIPLTIQACFPHSYLYLRLVQIDNWVEEYMYFADRLYGNESGWGCLLFCICILMLMPMISFYIGIHRRNKAIARLERITSRGE